MNENDIAYISFVVANPNYLDSAKKVQGIGIIKKNYRTLRLEVDTNHEHFPLKLKISEFADEFRSKFPAGKKSTTAEVAAKLTWLMGAYPQYSKEEILDARDEYLKDFQGDTLYCKKAGNFIKKSEGNRNTDHTSFIVEILEKLEMRTTTPGGSLLGMNLV